MQTVYKKKTINLHGWYYHMYFASHEIIAAFVVTFTMLMWQGILSPEDSVCPHPPPFIRHSVYNFWYRPLLNHPPPAHVNFGTETLGDLISHVGGKVQGNPCSEVGTENPIHIVPSAWFESESMRWKARKGTTTTTYNHPELRKYWVYSA